MTHQYGVTLILADDIQQYIEERALEQNTEVSVTIKTLLRGVSALNYMDQTEPFPITREMLEDPKYFDKLFIDWHERQMSASRDV